MLVAHTCKCSLFLSWCWCYWLITLSAAKQRIFVCIILTFCSPLVLSSNFWIFRWKSRNSVWCIKLGAAFFWNTLLVIVSLLANQFRKNVQYTQEFENTCNFDYHKILSSTFILRWITLNSCLFQHFFCCSKYYFKFLTLGQKIRPINWNYAIN